MVLRISQDRAVSSSSLGSIMPLRSVSLVEDYSDDEYRSSNSYEKPVAGLPSLQNVKSKARGQMSLNEKQIDGMRKLAIAFLQGPASEISVKLVWLFVFESVVPKKTRQFEWASVAVPTIVGLGSKALRCPATKLLPGPLIQVVGCLSYFAIPAAILIGKRMIGKLLSMRKREDVCASDASNLHSSSSGESTVITPASMVQAAAEQKPQLAREYVNIFNPSLMKLRGLIDWEQMEEAPRLAHRFTPSNCELMRFGAQSSLHLATTEATVEESVNRAAGKINQTLRWSKTFEFITPQELKKDWSHLVVWTKRLERGHPALLVRLGDAMKECVGEKAEDFSRATISQVDRGVRKLLKDDATDQMVTVVDCQGANSYQVTRHFGLFRRIPACLSEHYPGRLHSLHLVNVPSVLRWVVQAIKPFVHPVTRGKFNVYGSNKASYPPGILEVVEWNTAKREVANHVQRPTQSSSPFSHDDAAPVSGNEAPQELSENVRGVPPLKSKHPRRDDFDTAPLTTFFFLIVSCVLTLIVLHLMRHMDLAPVEEAFKEDM